jgi:hypothetical protein
MNKAAVSVNNIGPEAQPLVQYSLVWHVLYLGVQSMNKTAVSVNNVGSEAQLCPRPSMTCTMHIAHALPGSPVHEQDCRLRQQCRT